MSLLDNASLLSEFLERAKTDDRFLGQLATVMRLLVCTFGSHRPLLIAMMKHYGYEGLTLEFDQPGGKKRKTISQFLSEVTYATKLKSGAMESVTVENQIRQWAEQFGGAHVDHAIDETLHNNLNAPIFVGGTHISKYNLFAKARTILAYYNAFAAQLEKKGVLTLTPGTDKEKP